jgi:hypothetical protein
MSEKSTRRLRFEKVATKRMQKLLDQIELVGNCSNKVNYEYNDEDVEKMFAAIDEQVKLARSKFGKSAPVQEERKFSF